METFNVSTPSEPPKQSNESPSSAVTGTHATASKAVMVVITLSQPAALGITWMVVPIWAESQVRACCVEALGRFSVTKVLAVALQAFSVTVTVYVPDAEG